MAEADSPKGWCYRHYTRWLRFGNPDGPSTNTKTYSIEMPSGTKGELLTKNLQPETNEVAVRLENGRIVKYAVTR